MGSKCHVGFKSRNGAKKVEKIEAKMSRYSMAVRNEQLTCDIFDANGSIGRSTRATSPYWSI